MVSVRTGIARAAVDSAAWLAADLGLDSFGTKWNFPVDSFFMNMKSPR
ncbi:hypothetical protein [Frankia sp. AgKG'84/4]|nr:hypothetical protein [Frankia sp. AgKG'84/4]MCL9793203.1 hypothetical protein [Frankia sp. AgKG'84/4]